MGAGPRSADAPGRPILKFIPPTSDSVPIPMTVLGIDTIAIVVSDPRKAIEWYRDVLGLDVAYIGPTEPNPDPSVQGTPENPGHCVELGPARPRTRVHLCFMRGETEPCPLGDHVHLRRHPGGLRTHAPPGRRVPAPAREDGVGRVARS